LGTGAGTFLPKADYDTSTFPISLAIGEVTGDGLLDLVSANTFANSISVLQGTGDGAFGPRVDYPAGIYPQSLVLSDLNEDGFLDLTLIDYGADAVGVMLGTGHP